MMPFLIDSSRHIMPILREIIQRGVQCYFHTPNGLHITEIDEDLAELLFKAGFKTLRLGLETSNEDDSGKDRRQGKKPGICERGQEPE